MSWFCDVDKSDSKTAFGTNQSHWNLCTMGVGVEVCANTDCYFERFIIPSALHTWSETKAARSCCCHRRASLLPRCCVVEEHCGIFFFFFSSKPKSSTVVLPDRNTFSHFVLGDFKWVVHFKGHMNGGIKFKNGWSWKVVPKKSFAIQKGVCRLFFPSIALMICIFTLQWQISKSPGS